MVGTGATSVKPSGLADKALPIGTHPRGTETQTERATRARVRSGRRNGDERPAGVNGCPRAVAAIAARASLGWQERPRGDAADCCGSRSSPSWTNPL